MKYLQVKLSTQATSGSKHHQLKWMALVIDTEAFTDSVEMTGVSADEITIKTAKNGKQRRELLK